MTPRTSTLSVDRICSRLSSGITSMMRSIAFEAEFACSVPITRTPVSAAWMARPMVSRSRISPTISTSGDSRRALRSAAANDSACLPTWRWVMTALWLVCRYSIGSSMLITCLRGLVDLVHHRRQGGRLARPGRPGHQDQAVVEIGEPFHRRGHPQLVQGGDLVLDHPEHRAEALALDEHVGAEARHAGQLVDEVDLALLLELGALLLGHDLQQEAARLQLGERAERERQQIPFVPDDGHVAGVEMEVRGALLGNQPQEGVEARHLSSPSAWRRAGGPAPPASPRLGTGAARRRDARRGWAAPSPRPAPSTACPARARWRSPRGSGRTSLCGSGSRPPRC